MNIINVKVNFTRGTCEVSGINLITGDYNSTKMVFTFDRDDGTKIFEMKSPSEELVMVQEIQNNEIVLYGLDDNEQVASLFKEDGSYIFEISLYENGSKLTSASGKLKVKPEQVVIDDEVVEAYIPVFDQLLNDITTTVQGLEDDVDDKLDGVDAKLDDVDTKLLEVDNKLDDVDGKIDTIEGQIETAEEIVAQANNLDLDISKSGKTTTVTITKKDETTESENILDGKNLEFVWSGTSLGVRVEGDSEYTYVNLQGVQGPVGPQGEPFKIKKTYSSISEMNADFNNMNIGDYVMIANSVETEDNAKLYTKTITQWVFITDFSGATGIQGPTGPAPSISIGTVTSGSTSSVTRTGTDENPVFNFVLEKGDKGDTGATGATGNGIASITKISSVDTTDTYRITYTDGTTYDYEITNGEVSQKQLDEVKAELERYKLIENALPKITGTGTSITLNNTADSILSNVLNPSQLSQEATPTPDNPQDIHTISGDNSVVVEGKNIFNATTSETTYREVTYSANETIVKVNGTRTAEGFINFEYFTLPAGTYTLNVKLTNGSITNSFFITLADSNNTEYVSSFEFKSDNNYTNSKSFTLSEEKSLRFRLYVFINTAFTNAELSYQVTTGSTSDYDFEPYVSQTAPINLPVENLLENTLTSTTKNGITAIVNEDKSVTLNGTATALTWIILNRAFTYEVGDYTISLNPTELVSGLAIYSDPFGDVPKNRTISITATTTPDVSLRITSGTTLNNVTVYPQLEKGTKVNSYTPYGTTPIEYCKIGNYEDEFILTSGKNKLDLTDLTYIKSINTTGTWSNNAYTINGITYIFNEGGTIKVNGTSTGNAGLYLYGTSINQKNIDGKYILLGSTINNIIFRVINYTNGYNTLGTNNSATTPTQLDLSQYNTGYIEIMIYSGQTINNVLLTPMLTETSTTDYEPYGTNEWYLKKNIGKVVLNGSESWATWYQTSNSNIGFYYTMSGLAKIGNESDYNNALKCNRFSEAQTRYDIYIGTTEAIKQCGNTGNQYIALGLAKTRLSDWSSSANATASLKTWLSNNNVTCYYVLSTPTYTQITGTLAEQLENVYQKLLSYKGQTNISQVNDDLPFVINSSALKDLSSL